MPDFVMMANNILRGRQIDNWFFKCYDALIVFLRGSKIDNWFFKCYDA